MKRASIAELTLAKQIRNLDTEIAYQQLIESDTQIKIEVLNSMRTTMQQEIAHLQAQRVKASQERKP